MDVVDAIQTVGVVGALLASTYQTYLLRRESNDREAIRREEAALQLHKDINIDGEAALACRRLSLSLREQGMGRFGRETWAVPTEDDFRPGGVFDHSTARHEQNYADLYRTLWSLERVYTFEKSGLVDTSLLYSLIGFHIWWWNQLLREVRHPVVMAKVMELGKSAEDWARENNELDDWLGRCQNDFNNSGPVNLWPATEA